MCIFDDANYVDETQMLLPIMLMVQNLILVGDSKNVQVKQFGIFSQV